jgi:predicted ATPase/DNA-binding CsgD family transcriptional regulator/class 3 adenylate cyclase
VLGLGAEGRRTYDVLAARLSRPVALWPVRLASTLMRSLGLVATQTLTFLFADIEGSAAMRQRLGDGYAGVLAEYRPLVRAGLAGHGGEEAGTESGEFSAVFASPRACAEAAIGMQRALISHRWPGGTRVRVRMGIDCGKASRTAALAGLEAGRAARVAAVACGGQVLVSAAAAGLLRDGLPEGAWLTELGWHRLADRGRAEQLFQLQAEGLPTASARLGSVADRGLLTNLPAPVSSFIGREGELAAVRALVAGARLVTLAGAGGAGKTRLGLQVAAGLLDGTGDGVWFADLAPLRDPDLVAVAVAGVLGVRPEPGRPVLDTLVAAVGRRRLLVVLDNCEHLIGACAKLADALLRGCPNLALLATSREPLGIGGERVYRVPSLGLPAEADDAAAIRDAEAVRLLADRAAAQGVPLAEDGETAQLAGRICRRLDGIPLAIELAAARLRMMPAAELEARLDERFEVLTGGSRAALPRQQTLRAMVDWSWELLHPAERAVLSRLSVFAGGFGLAAAEAVAADPDVPPGEVLGLLGALVDKSLVQFDHAAAGSGRYRLLETVRQYAAGQLDALDPAVAGAARMAHRDYYLALAEAADPELIGPDQAAWLDRLDAELGNLRAAIAFSLTQPDAEPGLRLAASLRAYWMARGHAAEGADVLRALLDAPAAQAATLPRARALATEAHLLQQTGGYAIAGDYCEEALAIARAAGDDYLVADLLHVRSWLLVRQGQPSAALPLIEQGLSLARRLGEPHLTARLLSARAFATNVEGDPAGAARDNAEALRLSRQVGDRLQAGTLLCNLSDYELWAGDLDAARRHLAESLAIARALNARNGAVIGTFNLGLAEYLGGSPGAAEALFAESLGLARRMGMKRHTAYALIGLALAGHGGADPGWSARLHGAADQALADLGHALQPLEERLAAQDRQRLRAAMGDAAFEAGYAAGRALDPAQALELATGTGAGAGAAPVPVDPLARLGLTEREREVLVLLAAGRSNPEIGKALFISTKTASVHVSNILAKLGVTGRGEAAAVAHRLGVHGPASNIQPTGGARRTL